MIDTARLVPPGYGPKANPLLFGVSEGLSRLFPLPEAGPAPARQGSAQGPKAASRQAAPAPGGA